MNKIGFKPPNNENIQSEINHSETIRLPRDNASDLEFEGMYLGQTVDDTLRWHYIVFKTDESVKSCDYILHIDYSDTIVHTGRQYNMLKFNTIEDIKHISKKEEISDSVLRDLLEILGINTTERIE